MMNPTISASVVLTRDEIVHLYSGGVLKLTIKGKEAEASVELLCLDAPPTRATRIRFRTVMAD